MKITLKGILFAAAAVFFTAFISESAFGAAVSSNETAPKQTVKLKIAVLDFDSETGIDKKELSALAQVMKTELENAGLLNVMSDNEVKKRLKGSPIGTADLASEDSTAIKKLGKLLNARLAVTGVINSALKDISMNIHFLDLETGDVLLAETPSCAEDSVFREMHEIALDIADKISNAGPSGIIPSSKPVKVRTAPENMIIVGNFPRNCYDSIPTPGKWSFYQNWPATGSIDISSNICTVKTEKRSGNPWDVMVFYYPIQLLRGNYYTISFDVRSDKDRKFFVGIGKNWGDYQTYFNRKPFESTPEWQTITFGFACKYPDDNAKIEFDCATEDPTIYFRNVSMTVSTGDD